MLKYILHRIFLFIPTFIVISLLAFIISVNAPGDPVARLMSSAETGNEFQPQSELQMRERQKITHRLGLDLPVFYFSITPFSFPDTLYKIYDHQERDAVKSLLTQYGNWGAVEAFHSSIKKIILDFSRIRFDSSSQKLFTQNEIRDTLKENYFNAVSLLTTSQPARLQWKMTELGLSSQKFPFLSFLKNDLDSAQKNFDQLASSSQHWKNYFPVIHFYPHNQYHRWLFGDGGVTSKGLLSGDLGISLISQLNVSTVIWEHIGWSLLLTLISVLLAYLISIPIGIRAAVKRDATFDRTSSVILFVLHSMPAFWVGTLLLILFANPEMLPWFPSSGVKPVTGYPFDATILEKVKLSLPYLILPLITYTYSSLAFLSRLTRVSMLEIIHQDFIRTARAKGLSEHAVIYKHAFRNALLPVITVFANILPAALGGSVIIESIFSIPGMGRETFEAIGNQDYPLIVGVFTLTGILTLIGYLFADILYAIADPRISFSKK